MTRTGFFSQSDMTFRTAAIRKIEKKMGEKWQICVKSENKRNTFSVHKLSIDSQIGKLIEKRMAKSELRQNVAFKDERSSAMA